MAAVTAPNLTDARARREQDHFDRLAAQQGEVWWGHTTTAGRLRMARRAGMLVERLSGLSSPRILEVGCGAGMFTQVLLRGRPHLELVAVDVSPASAALARIRCAGFSNLTVAVADVLDRHFDFGQFEAVVGNSVLHHVDLEVFLRRACRWLRPGGLLWFSEPNMINPQVALERRVRFVGRWMQNSEDETAFIRWRLRRTLTRSGYEVVAIRPFDFLHPACPERWIAPTSCLGRLLERVPLVREIAGSLEIVARTRPGGRGTRRCPTGSEGRQS
jgi:SAM-dependent methyltransferase